MGPVEERAATPKKKDFPDNPLPKTQHDLLFHPESNPTGYEVFEDASTNPFQPEARTWSRVNAWWLADASWLAYSHDEAAVRDVFRERAGLPSCRAINGAGTECYLAHDDRFAIVTFRGTQPDDWNDLFNIFQFVPIAWDVGFVHQGFAAALDAIWVNLEAALAQLPANCRIWLTGHSLGAALATLTAVRLEGRASGLYTFGAPRIGDAVFAARVGSLLQEASIRYVNDRDGVTRVPPEGAAHPRRYTHADHLRWIHPNGQVGTTRPLVDHLLPDVFGPANSLLAMVDLSQLGFFEALPDFLIDHTPLYYALHTWNDYADHGN